MSSAPYDTVESVLNTARVRLNDAIVSVGGDILTDTAAFTQTAVNAAWRRMQEYLSDKGVAALNREMQYPSVPPLSGTDQGLSVAITWDGYDNGGGSLQPFWALPQDMIAPLDLYERIYGSTGAYMPMDQVLNGLPTAPKDTLNRTWEWRQETVYMPGALGFTDIRLRYAGFLGDFVTVAPVLWYQQPVPIMRSLNSLAWFICAEVARPRGDLDAGAFEQLAQQSAEAIWNRDPRQGKSIFKRSEYGKMTGPNTPTRGPAGPRGQQE